MLDVYYARKKTSLD